jgi:hypothetical protein
MRVECHYEQEDLQDFAFASTQIQQLCFCCFCSESAVQVDKHKKYPKKEEEKTIVMVQIKASSPTNLNRIPTRVWSNCITKYWMKLKIPSV